MGYNKKTNRARWIANVAIILTISIFLLVTINLYTRNRNLFHAEMNDILEISLRQHLSDLTKRDSRGIISSRNDSTIFIVRDRIEHVCKIHAGMDIDENITCGVYDIAPLNTWNTDHLSNIIRHHLSDRTPPFLLSRTDSTGKIIDFHKFHVADESIHDLQYKHTLPLGFLDKHQLTIRYTYPWQLFWYAKKGFLLIALLLLATVAACVILLFKLLRNAHKKAENRELFVQALNHDMKSPIAALQIRMFQIKDCSATPYSPEQEELYIKTRRQIKTILASADRLLQDSIDAKGINLNVQAVDLPELINKQVAAITETVKPDNSKKIEIDTSFHLSNPLIYADAHHLSRVIQNLLQNAVKYSGTNVRIRITCQEEGKFVQIILQDNGDGIAKSDLKHIFERNYRSRKTAKIKGYGIGLSYVKMIVRAHEGTVRVESKPNEETTFTIRLKHGRKD